MDDLISGLEASDLEIVMMAFTDAFQKRAGMLLSVSGPFCRAASPEFPELCPPDTPLPGDSYGHRVNEIPREQALKSVGLFDFPRDLTEEELHLRLDYVQPGIEDSLKTARDHLAALEPLPKFSADHQIILAFFEEQYQTALDSTAAKNAGDSELILDLFDRSNENAAGLEQLSDEYRRIVLPLVGP